MATSIYGQYDNGASVFNLYWNFSGTSLPQNWASNGKGSYSVNNGLTVYNGSSSANIVYFSNAINPQIYVVDFYGYTNSSDSKIGLSVAGSFLGNPSYFIDPNYYLDNYNGSFSNVSLYPSASKSSCSLWSMWANSTASFASYNYTVIASNSINFGLSTAMYIQLTTSRPNYVYMQWIRTRAYPPNGVMPAVNRYYCCLRNLL
jgi:hypothetical protein